MSDKHDFNVQRGTTWNTELTFTQDDGTTPVDFSGLTNVQFALKAEPNDISAVLTLSIGNGITRNANVFAFTMTAAQTAALMRDHYHYQLVLGFGVDVVIPMVGKFLMNNGGVQ